MSQALPESPGESAQIPPRDLYQVSDIRFVLLQLGETRADLRNLGEKIDKLAERTRAVERSVDRFKAVVTTALACVGIVLPAFGGLFWWAEGSRISALLKPAEILQQQQQGAPGTSAPKP